MRIVLDPEWILHVEEEFEVISDILTELGLEEELDAYSDSFEDDEGEIPIRNIGILAQLLQALENKSAYVELIGIGTTLPNIAGIDIHLV